MEEHQHHEMMHTTMSNNNHSDAFCTGGGMVMLMEGFAWNLTGGHSCLNLLFTSWTLNSRTKFVGAMVGVFFYAMGVEYLAKCRIWIRSLVKVHPVLRPTVPLLHGLQALTGYSLMLITMTFSAELFLAVVCGLTVGYYWFFCPRNNNNNDRQRMETQQLLQHVTTNPCCEFIESENREVLPGSLSLDEDTNGEVGVGLG